MTINSKPILPGIFSLNTSGHSHTSHSSVLNYFNYCIAFSFSISVAGALVYTEGESQPCHWLKGWMGLLIPR